MKCDVEGLHSVERRRCGGKYTLLRGYFWVGFQPTVHSVYVETSPFKRWCCMQTQVSNDARRAESKWFEGLMQANYSRREFSGLQLPLPRIKEFRCGHPATLVAITRRQIWQEYVRNGVSTHSSSQGIPRLTSASLEQNGSPRWGNFSGVSWIDWVMESTRAAVGVVDNYLLWWHLHPPHGRLDLLEVIWSNHYRWYIELL